MLNLRTDGNELEMLVSVHLPFQACYNFHENSDSFSFFILDQKFDKKYGEKFEKFRMNSAITSSTGFHLSKFAELDLSISI